MLDNLKDLVKQYAGNAIINNPDIPNERNEEAVTAASDSIVDGLKNAVSTGNISDLTSMFKGSNPADSGVAQQIQGGFMQKLVDQFGLNPGQASSVAGGLIPTVIDKFVHKTNDPNDSSFDLNSIIGHLTGGGGVQDLLNKFTGSGEGGGLMGTLTGFFGKKE